GLVLILITIPCVLMLKRESTSAVAWCLLVFFLPVVGSFLFVVFGYQHVHRPLRRKKQHKRFFRLTTPSSRQEAIPGPTTAPKPATAWQGMAQLAQRVGGFPLTSGNQITFYQEGRPAFEAMLDAI